MSAGLFLDSFYSAQYATAIHPIRVQPETTEAVVTATSGTVANSPATGPATSPISAQCGSSTRRLGLHAPVIYAKLIGTPPTGYAPNSRVTIPCLGQAFFLACIKASQIDYLGTQWVVTGRRAEVVR